MVLILESKEISQAVIGRLPRYYRYLGELEKMGIERVSSHELSSLMHVTASQIRQDFNNFGGFGQQGYGYNIHYLHEEIGKILGLDQHHDMILIGAGHLGSALVNYMKFTGKPLEEIERDVERDHFLTAEEALSYGLIDEIIPPRR